VLYLLKDGDLDNTSHTSTIQREYSYTRASWLQVYKVHWSKFTGSLVA
jgi:hypothetical protein